MWVMVEGFWVELFKGSLQRPVQQCLCCLTFVVQGYQDCWVKAQDC